MAHDYGPPRPTGPGAITPLEVGRYWTGPNAVGPSGISPGIPDGQSAPVYSIYIYISGVLTSVLQSQLFCFKFSLSSFCVVFARQVSLPHYLVLRVTPPPALLSQGPAPSAIMTMTTASLSFPKQVMFQLLSFSMSLSPKGSS